MWIIKSQFVLMILVSYVLESAVDLRPTTTGVCPGSGAHACGRYIV